jgi:hypothetical protein
MNVLSDLKLRLEQRLMPGENPPVSSFVKKIKTAKEDKKNPAGPVARVKNKAIKAPKKAAKKTTK